MKRSGTVKFPNSVQLFKFCQKVLTNRRGTKIRDQEVGAILNFNPSDCSHWKRGEKNVKSVFALAKLSEALGVEAGLIHDVASGHANLDEAYFEYSESKHLRQNLSQARTATEEDLAELRKRVESFASQLHQQAEFRTPPLYLPEVVRNFAFVSTQPVEMIDKLSRILRVKPGQYCIQFRKGDLRPQTRMSVVKDLARVLFEGERARFPELGKMNPDTVGYEEFLFTANLLAPKQMILTEMARMDSRKNMVAELASLFWVPKSLIGFQLQDIVRTSRSAQTGLQRTSATQVDTTTVSL